MAGIGFSLRKMLKEDQTYAAQVRSWFHTSIVVAGPWIISIITINMLIYFSRTWNISYAERELLIATVVYATLFSQLLTAPFQMLVTRYIADRIFSEELAYIKPSFWGVSLILLIISFFTSLMFFRRSSLPIEFIYIAISLFVVMTTMWILMTYLSTLKNYRLITFSNFIGAVVTFILILIFSSNPVPFREMSGGTNLLLAYFGGMFIILLFLLVVFLSELSQDNGKLFHFIRYFHAEPSLWPIGLFYTLSLWIDNILMWFSPAGIVLFGVYRYAPSYDIATFYAYLSTLPASMMFMVLIETEFYVQCREFYNGVLNNAALSELEGFAERMRRSLFQEVLKTFEVQLVISLLLIILSPTVFPVLNVSDAIRKIFMMYALGALCNSFILIFLQVLLYIGERNKALIMVIIFFSTNILFTYISIGLGENFYGAGFFLSGFVTMVVGAVFSFFSYNNVIRSTFMSQPVYVNKREKIFEKVEKWIDNRQEIKDAFKLKLLRNKKIARFIKWQKPAEVVESKRAYADIPIPVLSDNGFLATYGGPSEQGGTGLERVDLFELTEIPPHKTPQKKIRGYGPYADRFLRNHYLPGRRRKSGFRR